MVAGSSKKNYFLIGIIVVLVLIIIGGYFILNNKNTKDFVSSQNLTQQVEKKPISSSVDLALSLSDLPSGWEIASRGERTKSDVAESGIALGWKEGYNIVFRMTDSKDISITQAISKYPSENVSMILKDSEDTLAFFESSKNLYRRDSWGEWVAVRLTKLGLGDYEVESKKVYLSNPQVFYYIEFTKGDYYVYLEGNDYEVIKELANKVLAKF